jgi:hypothetical protein
MNADEAAFLETPRARTRGIWKKYINDVTWIAVVFGETVSSSRSYDVPLSFLELLLEKRDRKRRGI